MTDLIVRNRHGFLTWRSWRNLTLAAFVEFMTISGAIFWLRVIW